MALHVYPVNDEREHDTSGTSCDCDPRIELVNGEMLVIHNSWDFREYVEQAEDIMNSIGK